MVMRLLLLLTLFIATPSSAQVHAAPEEPITADTPTDPARLLQWLHSGDPRLIAWAGYFARTTQDIASLDDMIKLLDDWPAPSTLSQKATYQASLAQSSLLDALIQTRTKVPPATISRIVSDFPTQAFLLAALLPPAEATPLLEQWYRYGSAGWSSGTTTRIAAMMLAKTPSADFAASILRDAEEALYISVVTEESGGGLVGMGSSCGDGGGGGDPQGWPVVYTYSLEEDNESAQGPTLIALGDDRITYGRLRANGGWGSCYGVQPLNAITRHRLIAYWLAVSPDDMPWQPQSREVILFKSRDQYLRELGAIVDRHRAVLAATVQQLREKKILASTGDASAMPHLTVSIRCDSNPCPLKTP